MGWQLVGWSAGWKVHRGLTYMSGFAGVSSMWLFILQKAKPGSLYGGAGEKS